MILSASGNGRFPFASRVSAVCAAILAGLLLTSVTGCDQDRNQLDEAMEEVKDEAEDTKQAIEDEIDDHS